VLAIAALTLWRLALAWPGRPAASAAGVVVIVVMLIAGVAWLRAGPLSPHWSSRSGTGGNPPAGAARPDQRPSP
jgi:hypothetical protein